MESPNFSESMLPSVPTKKVRETFNRREALAQCPPHLSEQLLNLFKQIDQLDLGINYYDLIHGKRKKEIRPQLLAKFTEEEQRAIEDDVLHWNQYYYLKQKHLLVELRREQFTLRDGFVSGIQRHTAQAPSVFVSGSTDFDSDVTVLPLGVVNPLIFKKKEELNPWGYDEAQLKKVSDYLWEYKAAARQLKSQQYFDFRELEHIYQLFLRYFDVQNAAEFADVYSTTGKLLETLRYYANMADLSDLHKLILNRKMNHVENDKIAREINQKYGKGYSANYISTIFRQRILPKITDAARAHEELIENLFFEENWKKCTYCGIWLLRTNDYFVKKNRSPDGLNTRCKKCDKLIREKKKNGESW